MIRRFRFTLIITGLLFTCTVNQASGLPGKETVQTKPPVHDKNPKSAQPETGKTLYQKYCLTCHQADGGGVPFTFPSLIKSDWVNGDKTRLIKIVLNGLEGDITVGEDTFSGVMPKLNNLNDLQIATVLTWLRTNFENKAGEIKPVEVKALRANQIQKK